MAYLLFYNLIYYYGSLMIVVFKKFEKLYRKNLNYDLAFCIIQLVKGINYRL